MEASLLGLSVGLIFEIDHMFSMVLVFNEVLNICMMIVKYLLHKCYMFMLSGPFEMILRALCNASIWFDLR